MRYIPHTSQDIDRMLRTIGASSVDDLFASIPEKLRFRGKLDLPPAMCEAELLEHLRELGAQNHPQSRAGGTLVFAGAGVHRHVIPAAVDAITSRSELYTAYTPYQPELSQGTLLGIFEFQTIVAELFGMEVANASMYDGASATAEAVIMARRMTGRTTTLLASTLHPEYARVCATYVAGLDAGQPSLRPVPYVAASGGLDLAALTGALDETIAAVVVQSPNFFGVLEDLAPISAAAHKVGALVIAVCAEPLALALARPPGDAGADIAVGEGLGLSGPPSLGGPGVGLFAVKDRKAVRHMPGRLVGETVDTNGRTGYVLTLATREQHIRREKATSNICTNHGLMALRLTIHLSLLGKTGFRRLAELNLAKAADTRVALCSMDGFKPRFSGPFFNEVAVTVAGGDAEEAARKAAIRGVVAGVPLGRYYPELKDTLLVGVNETHRREDIVRLTKSFKSIA